MTAAEVSEGLGLGSLKNRQWHICKTSAVKGEGLQGGLDWCEGAFFFFLVFCRGVFNERILCRLVNTFRGAQSG